MTSTAPRARPRWYHPTHWRPPLVRQHERADCGPACLLMVLRHWGGDASLAEVRERAGTDRSGTTLLGLQRAAEELGLSARGVRTDLDELRRELPAIVHLVVDGAESHFAVIFRLGRRSVLLGDPARGRRRVPREAVERWWRTRAALLVSPGANLHRSPPPPWWRWVAPYLRENAAFLGQTVFLGLLGTVLGLGSALGIQLLIDRFIPARDVEMIVWTGALLAGLVAARAGFEYLRRGLLLRIHRRLAVAMNRHLLARLYRLPLRFFDTRSTGEVTARLADAVRVQHALVALVGTSVMDGLIVLGSLLYLRVLAPPIALLASVAVPAYVLLLARALAPYADRQREALAGRARVESAWIDALAGMVEILAHGVSGTFRRVGGSRFRDFQAGLERLGRVQADVTALAELAGGILVAGTLVWGALLVVQEALLVGELVAGYALLAGLLPASERLVGAWGSAREASVAAERLGDILAAPPEPRRPGARSVPAVRELALREPAIERPPGSPLLRGGDLVLVPGELVALAGPVGSGKSTLLRAFARLVPLAGGDLLLNGIPAETFDLDEYRRRIALCTGSPRIFQGTLGQNVALGRPGPDRASAGSRLCAAAAAHLLPRFPHGWETILGEGGRILSDGERQLVGYLRALWSSPEVFLADEAVSAADEAIGELVLGGLEAYARDHIVVLVTHDREALRRAGRVIRVAEGRIHG